LQQAPPGAAAKAENSSEIPRFSLIPAQKAGDLKFGRFQSGYNWEKF
jgi:hypothetical protein